MAEQFPLSSIVVGIPAFNEAKNIRDVIKKAKVYCDKIIVCEFGPFWHPRTSAGKNNRRQILFMNPRFNLLINIRLFFQHLFSTADQSPEIDKGLESSIFL